MNVKRQDWAHDSALSLACRWSASREVPFTFRKYWPTCVAPDCTGSLTVCFFALSMRTSLSSPVFIQAVIRLSGGPGSSHAGSIAEFGLGVRIDWVDHAMRARTRVRASLPGSMATMLASTLAVGAVRPQARHAASVRGFETGDQAPEQTRSIFGRQEQGFGVKVVDRRGHGAWGLPSSSWFSQLPAGFLPSGKKSHTLR